MTATLKECQHFRVGRPTNAALTAFGHQLQRWLTHLGVSQAELASRTGIDETNIAHWVRVAKDGTEREPGYTKVRSMANALHITVDQLISGDPSQAATMAVRDSEMRVVLAYRNNRRVRAQIDQIIDGS